MRQNLLKLMLAIALMGHGDILQSREPYHASITVDTTTETVSAPNFTDLSHEMRNASLEQLLPIYTPTSPVFFDINLRGIDVLASFAANSNALVVTIPQLGVTETFTGATRDESAQLFKDHIRDGGRHQKLLRAYARFSPIDPIAGNPNSLMAQMAQADYLAGHLSPLNGCDCCWNAQPIVHQFQLGAIYGRAFCKGFDTTTVTLPIRYSYSPDLEWAFIIDAPLTYNRNGGASSLFGSLGLGLRVPLAPTWSLTPIFRVGAGGSADLCTSGSFVSAGLTSVFNYKISEYVFTVTNYAGYISSTNLWLSDINFNYHLQNFVFKNGFSFTTCEGVCIFGRPIHFNVFFIDTYYSRERLFIRHYDEVGVSLFTTCLNPCVDYDCLRLGFSYQYGQKDYKGYFLSLIYQF